MSTRFCMPRVSGRGAGLGNELIPWARSFVCAQILDATALPPAFGMNRRRYWRHFGTPRYDWLTHRALVRLLPTFEFSEADYIENGGGDVACSFHAYAEQQGLFERKAYVVTTGGMWGGYGHVAAARDFVRSTLYRSRFAARNLLRIRQQLDPELPIVGMHVRMGDFQPVAAEAAYKGRFNVSLPLQWYVDIARSLQQQMGQNVQFVIASDATLDQLMPLSRGLRCVVTSGIPDSDCSDLLALAQADLLVCSVSSFSAWAAFLTSAPYIWYAPNLQHHSEGFHSIWGHETLQQQPTGATLLSIAEWQHGRKMVPRGHAVANDGEVPSAVVEQVMTQYRQRSPFSDLVQYGVVPSNGHSAASAGVGR